MIGSNDATGRFCWMDLAATDAGRAKAFYARLFGWTASDRTAGGGIYTRLRLRGDDVASLYQLSSTHIEHGVPSHWTPYVRVDDAQAAAQHAQECGGAIVVPPHDVPGIARIALVLDAVGAPVGLWQPAVHGHDAQR